MSSSSLILIALAAILLLTLLTLVLLLTRGRDGATAELLQRLADWRERGERDSERLERSLRGEVAEAARLGRDETSEQMMRFQQTLSAQMTHIATLQNNQIDMFAQQLAKLTESNERRLGEVRTTLEQKLKDIEANNAARLDEMRRTVDEKLHATLEQRLGESFRMVSDRLEQVHRGLGEMQMLAQGVGDLKRVLTNVKTRGTWGEVQLEMLLQQILTPEQYARNVETVPNSGARVEFAIRLPGKEVGVGNAAGNSNGNGNGTVWLPIDAKFPKEQYERLTDAQEHGDVDGVAAAGRELEVAIKREAQTIAEKYLSPPATTDFAILFLPTEGLYAEVLRRPGLTDLLQRNHRVTVAGPTTLTAVLNSLQMGFRTLAIEQRSSEVWSLLGAVKSEFGKFAGILEKAEKQISTVGRSLGEASRKTRTIELRLRGVESLGSEQTDLLLADAAGDDDDTGVDDTTSAPT